MSDHYSGSCVLKFSGSMVYYFRIISIFLHDLLFITHFHYPVALDFEQFSRLSASLCFFNSVNSYRSIVKTLRFHSKNINMGGRSIWREPLVLEVSDAAREILARAGWLTYFNHLQEYNGTVVIEFLQNLQEDYSIIRGKCIAITDDIIV